MDDLMLEQLIARSAAATGYPPTPSLRGGVFAAISSTTTTTRGVTSRPPFAFAALALAFAVALAFAIPSSRSSIAGWFGIEDTKVEHLPTPAPGVTPTPLPTPADITAIATPTTLDAAAQRLEFQPAVPEGKHASGVYLVPFIGPEPFVVMQFDDFDLWEAQLEEGFVTKAFGGTTILTDLTINGRAARWFSGGSHIVRYVGANGVEIAASQRTVTRNTLVWRTPYAFYRIETDLPLANAVTIAEMLP